MTRPLFSAGHLHAMRLPPTAHARVQGLIEACRDFHELVHGEPVPPTEGEATFISLPPGKDYDDKFVIGLEDDSGALVGLIDLIRDYPEPGDWFLGLLLLHPDQRRQGRGSAVYEAMAAWAAEQGASAIRLGVVNQNKAGVRFWQRQGFKDLKRRLMRFGQKDSIVRVMRHELGRP